MPDTYQPSAIESKWRQRWEDDHLYQVREDPSRPKWYELTMYPYPSGDLHIGHWYAMGPYDAHVRFKRMRGYNVLAPMGFDAFGLPAENAAIKRGIHPYAWTMGNIDRMRGQLKSMGAAFDWSREIICCLPEYYHWNQWFFLKMLKAGLAYKTKAPANWCPTDQTVLANEQVINGRCERCDSLVERRDLEQWFFRITKYADELLDFSGLIDWPEKIKIMQRNWIGRSEGVELSFDISHYGLPERDVRVFTTRPDTIFGVTFMVIAPEHPLVERLTTPERKSEVEAYVLQARRASEVERLSTDRPKTGVPIGAYCINPFNGERVPLFIADYVLASYGTGIVMAVPAHDERDFDFAKKHGLPIKVVISPPDWDGGELQQAYTDMGTMVNSGQFNGTPGERALGAIADYAEAHGIGKRTVSYRVRDWLVSRQRYWGTPIPIIYCPVHGTVPVPESDLPVLLPQDADFRPTGESPLKYHAGFLNTTCPACGGPAQRETDTMDTFVDSSWYYLRYLSPHYDRAPFDPSQAHWAPVDQYTGGAEHAVMHLPKALQSRNHPRRRPREDEQEPRQRRQPGRLCEHPRRRCRAPLLDVHRPLGTGGRLEHHWHPGRIALAQPRVGHRHPRGLGAARLGGLRRPEARHPQDDQEGDGRCGTLFIQHFGCSPHGADQHHEPRLGLPRDIAGRLEGVCRRPAADAGALGAPRGGGAVGTQRPPLQHPQPAMAFLG
ncbi:MAG: leucyl-tRNA synthetase [Dehalococcoidia bacterium]|nr:leucyl-tRNA synthetase [Dehalococcoidia bacterium]